MPKTYDGLIRFYMLRPIHDEVEFEHACEVVDALAGHELNEDQEDYLEALSTLVEAHENALDNERRDGMTPHLALVALCEENAVNGSQLGAFLGCSRSLGAKLLKGERRLTATHAVKLGERFKVSPTLFLSK